MSLQLDFTFDEKTYRNFLNGHAVVRHSHHYLALITKLVEDLSDIGGPRILSEVVEDSMRTILDDYFRQHAAASVADRFSVGESYFATFGLGKMVIEGDEQGGKARLLRSHLDEGWTMKWGEHSKPINYFTCGYLAALHAATFGKPARSYVATELESIVMGAAESRFSIAAA